MNRFFRKARAASRFPLLLAILIGAFVLLCACGKKAPPIPPERSLTTHGCISVLFPTRG